MVMRPSGSNRPLRVLVVVVNYRSAELALVAVGSALEDAKASENDVRVVVVENQSGDEARLREGLVGLSGVTLIVAERNGGFAYGNNIGFKFAYDTGWVPDYFHLLNPDTRVHPGAISELVNFLEAHPRAGIAGSRFIEGNGQEWPIAFRFPSVLSELDEGLRVGVVSSLLRPWVVARRMPDEPTQVDWLPGASMMIRAGVVEQIGGMDEGYFLYFEETDFCLKALRAGWETWHVPGSRVVHLAGQSTGVTGAEGAGKPLPDYWFASRSRYFRKNHGELYAAVTDAVAVGAHLVGNASLLVRRQRPARPSFARDLALRSLRAIRRHKLPPESGFFPPRATRAC
jgi:hypothetical protein